MATVVVEKACSPLVAELEVLVAALLGELNVLGRAAAHLAGVCHDIDSTLAARPTSPWASAQGSIG